MENKFMILCEVQKLKDLNERYDTIYQIDSQRALCINQECKDYLSAKIHLVNEQIKKIEEQFNCTELWEDYNE